jgi:hypothetical protein
MFSNHRLCGMGDELRKKQHIPAINSKCFQSVKQILPFACRRLINDSFQQHVMVFAQRSRKKEF